MPIPWPGGDRKEAVEPKYKLISSAGWRKARHSRSQTLSPQCD
jgi:hypothetical protein